jgi:hypothetical protein
MQNTRALWQVRLSVAVPVGVMFLFLLSVAATGQAQDTAVPYPVVCSIDLYYTINDIDDHFDAATLLKSPEVKLKDIILHNHHCPSDWEEVLEKLCP